MYFIINMICLEFHDPVNTVKVKSSKSKPTQSFSWAGSVLLALESAGDKDHRNFLSGAKPKICLLGIFRQPSPRSDSKNAEFDQGLQCPLPDSLDINYRRPKP